MRTLSTDFRLRILAAYDAGDCTQAEVARRFMVSHGMVKKLVGLRRHRGDLAPRHHLAGRHRTIVGKDEARLLDLHRKQPDATLEELNERLGIGCHIATIHRALKRLGLRYKKKT